MINNKYISIVLKVVITYIYILLVNTASAQEKKEMDFTYNRQISLGGNVLMSTFQTVLGIGEVSYSYHPIPVQLFFNLPLVKRAKRHQISFYTEWGIVPVILKPATVGLGTGNIKKYNASWEGGFHAGFLYNLLILEDLIFFTGMSSGPYYFATENNDKQRKGFLFSDNVTFGFRSRLSIFNAKSDIARKMEMVFHIRYRHMSNANMMKPNGGIDNILIGLGFSYLFKNK